MARQRRLASAPLLPGLPGGRKVAPGDSWEGVPALRARLEALGDLLPGAAPEARGDPGRYDAELVAAVQRFQKRHGLAADGSLGRQTLAAVDVPPERRARQIQLALERWRWLPDTLGERYLLVNIPGFTLAAREHGRTALGMSVVVGRELSRTPMFHE